MTYHIGKFSKLALCLLPWLILQLSTSPPGDASFLLHGAEKMINGHKMTEEYYDTNPPMSFLIYTPGVMLKALGLPQYQIITIYTIGLLLIATALLSALLEQSKITKDLKYKIVLGFLMATTIPFIIEFGQKDHLIAIGLVPIICAQHIITTHRKTNTTILLTLILFIPFILIKPHYGLIPLSIIIHRAYTQKRISTLWDIDTVIMGLGTLVYIGFTIIFMKDYINEALPKSLALYAHSPSSHDLKPIITALSFAFLTLCISALIWMQDRPKEDKNCILLIALSATLSIIPFVVQNQGFSLHLIPSLSLALIAIIAYISPYIPKSTTLTPIAISFILYAYVALSFMITGTLKTHNQFKNSQLINTIKKNAQNEPFFIEDTTTCASFISTTYIKNQVASRFPSMWFLQSALSLEENDKIKTLDTFGKYIANDFEKYKPKMIAFMLNENRDSPLKVIYKNHIEIQEQLKNYEYKETAKIENIDGCIRTSNNRELPLTLEIHTRKQ